MSSSTEPHGTPATEREVPGLPIIEPGRVLSCIGAVRWYRTSPLADELLRLGRIADKPILLVIDSPGGDSNAADALHTVINLIQAPVIGLVATRACSAGCEILQACRVRLAFPSSALLVHFSSITSTEPLTQANADARNVFSQQRRAAQEVQWATEVRTLAKRTGMELEAARQLLTEDRILPAREALALGLLDGIVGGK